MLGARLPLPNAEFSAYPVMNSTFRSGRCSRPASVNCRPFIPPGRPTSEIKRSTSDGRIFKPDAPSVASITPHQVRSELTSFRGASEAGESRAIWLRLVNETAGGCGSAYRI